jgi:hypothetical protein
MINFLIMIHCVKDSTGPKNGENLRPLLNHHRIRLRMGILDPTFSRSFYKFLKCMATSHKIHEAANKLLIQATKFLMQLLQFSFSNYLNSTLLKLIFILKLINVYWSWSKKKHETPILPTSNFEIWEEDDRSNRINSTTEEAIIPSHVDNLVDMVFLFSDELSKKFIYNHILWIYWTYTSAYSWFFNFSERHTCKYSQFWIVRSLFSSFLKTFK